MDADGVERAMAAVKSAAGDLGLPTHDVSIIHNSNKLALLLLPCDVFARVAYVGQEVAALEINIAQQLLDAGAPVAALEGSVQPQVYQCDGFAITWWTHYNSTSPDQLPSEDYAHALHCLHRGMRGIEVVAPHFLDRVEEAEDLISNPDQTPALDVAGRQLLLDTYSSARQEISRNSVAEQLLHGEPHPGNVLNTSIGPLFIDFETCCRGPIEFDVAHVPVYVAENYPDLDQSLLGECRRLVLAMVAAWRWDADDQFPDGLRYGRSILDLLRDGPPWPTIGDLSKA